jgi:hypothetical protein
MPVRLMLRSLVAVVVVVALTVKVLAQGRLVALGVVLVLQSNL